MLSKKNIRLLFVLKLLARAGHFFPIIDFNRISSLLRQLPINRIKRVRMCFLTGRVAGFSRFSGLSRFKTKQLSEKGVLPGVYRSSW